MSVAMSLASVLPGHCDFEAGLCDYSQDKQDNGTDWEWRRGPTPTSYTGPRGDHTTGLGKETYCQFTEVHKIIDNNNNNKVVKYTNTLKKKKLYYRSFIISVTRTLSAHGGISHATWSKYSAAVSPTEGLQGTSVSAVLLPHVWLRHRTAQPSP